RRAGLSGPPPRARPGAPPVTKAVVWYTEKSALPLSEPRRYRDRAHLKFVASQPCLRCERQPSEPHHLRFAQPRAMGRKVSDEFAVPLCRIHHRLLHRVGNELTWWKEAGIDPLTAAVRLWKRTRLEDAPSHPKQRKAPATAPSSPEQPEAGTP